MKTEKKTERAGHALRQQQHGITLKQQSTASAAGRLRRHLPLTSGQGADVFDRAIVETTSPGVLKGKALSPKVTASGVGPVEDKALGLSRSFSGAQFVRSTTRRPRLLWIGDAVVPTGFATVTHSVLAHLQQDWEVIVSGVNYDGRPHENQYHILPACQGGDMWGIHRFRELCEEVEPAVVVINSDWWHVARFVEAAPDGLQIVGYMPVDARGLDSAAMRHLNKLAAAVWYTRFGLQEATQAGFRGKAHVIPHGIDTSAFHPMDRDNARRALGLKVPDEAFIVGNLNRNQPRKRLDVTIEIFADWLEKQGRPEAYLLLHCALKDVGWNLKRIAEHHKVADRLLLTGCDDLRDLQDVTRLCQVYNSLDVQMTTTLGEGWGLTTMEGMACGIPQIVPDAAALGEWAVPAVKVPCSRRLWHPEINTVGALVDHAPFVKALDKLYLDKAERRRISAAGIDYVRRSCYSWKTIAGQFHQLIQGVINQSTANA